MDVRFAAFLACSLLLSGCASPSDDATAETLQDDALEAPMAGMDHSQPAAPAAAPEPLTVTCTMTRTQLGTSLGYGLNVDRMLVGIDDCAVSELFGGNTSWAQSMLVEATWTSQATQTGADLWVELRDCAPEIPPTSCAQASATGASSPLSLTLSGDGLRALEGREAYVMAAGEGVVQDLAFTLYVTLFPGEVPSGFSAVA